MSEVVMVAIISCVGTALTLFGGLWVARNKNKADVSISHRKSLSEDEQKFRTDLLTEVDSYRDKIQDLMTKMDTLSTVNSELRVMNIELRGMNAQLRNLNVELIGKISTMQASIDNVSCTSSTSTSTETTHTTSTPITTQTITLATNPAHTPLATTVQTTNESSEPIAQ